MELEYAYAKFQSLIAEEVYVRNIPVKLGKTINTDQKDDTFPHSLGLTKCPEITQDHCILFYSMTKKKFAIIAFQKTYIDHQECKLYYDYKGLYEKVRNSFTLLIFDEYEEYIYYLDNFSQIFLFCSKCDIPHVYYFILPDKETQKSETLYMKPTALLSISQNMSNPRNKIHDKIISSKWSTEDREVLKRLILLYGYGRWKKYQSQSLNLGGRLSEKPKNEIRAFANSLIRSLAEDTGNELMDLKQFLYSIVEEYTDDPYIQPNSKDWDIQNLKQRAVPYTKRLQLLYRIKVLIKRFQEDQLKNGLTKDKLNWENLLNFLPNSALYGQRPNNWWTKRHDTFLLRGVYKYGYANYQTIKQAPEYGFQELEKTNSYSDFPTSDALTRRLKKLISTIIKSEEDKGKIDFDVSASSQDEEKGWSYLEKKILFNYLKNDGIPLNTEGRSNWLEIREEIKNQKGLEQFDKSVSQIEKMVQKIRLQCQELIVQEDCAMEKQPVQTTEPPDQQINQETNKEEFVISFKEALLFNKNTNMLHFIRKQILFNQNQNFYALQDEIEKASSQMNQDHPAYIQHPEYISRIHDLSLLNLLSKKGFSKLNQEEALQEYNLHDKGLSFQKLIDRIDWISQTFKELKDKSAPKKRKAEKDFKDVLNKKQKIMTNKDDNGNIVYPIIISQSLKILKLGEINWQQQGYHSEQNLFPIGYVSIRTHASMLVKGGKCDYTCEILEGNQGKPLFRVTSEEDPEHPIVRESCSGCWLYVCEKVNQLSDQKKEKVTVSGPDRFGISQSSVAQLLEDLPNAEKCLRYKFKTKDIKKDMMDDADL